MKLKKGILYPSILFCLIALLPGGTFCADNPDGFSYLWPLLLSHPAPHPDGKKKCLADGGRIATEHMPNGEKIYVCELERCYTGDDGEFCQMHRCDLERYYDGTCVEPLPPSPPYVPDDTVSSYFHKKIVEIMENIYNTGYAHNADHNFSLLPDYTELKTTMPGTTEFNLFLDCSGFVGYYVIQGLADKLYRDATPSNYICQDRPLAADFADLIENAPEVDGTHPAATMEDLEFGEVCWGQVKHVENIKHGDVIVYKHPQHIGEKSDTPCHDGRTVYEVSGNTGHILFAHGTPTPSDHCKANISSCGKHADLTFGEWQYVVEVADSTTSQHMYDTRKENTVENGVSIDESDYYGHKYHAWTAGADKVLERCADGSYHRHCILHGTVPVEGIELNTKYENHPTGIGAGKMYISQDRKSYRSSYTSANVCSKKDLVDCSNIKGEVVNGEKIIFIGRPIHCIP